MSEWRLIGLMTGFMLAVGCATLGLFIILRPAIVWLLS